MECNVYYSIILRGWYYGNVGIYSFRNTIIDISHLGVLNAFYLISYSIFNHIKRLGSIWKKDSYFCSNIEIKQINPGGLDNDVFSHTELV